MYARVILLTGVQDIDAAVAYMKVNPETGEGSVSSIWDDEQTLQAAFDATEETRAEASSTLGVTIGERIHAELVIKDLE